MLNNPMPLALGAILLWASLATLGALTRTLPPFFVVGVSLCVGSLLSAHRIRDWKVPPLTLLTGIYGLFGYHFLLFFAFRQAPALEANLLNYLWPLLIVMLSPLLRPGTRLTRRHIIGGAMGFVGAGLIVTGGKLALSQQYLTGYLLAISAAMVWSTFSLLLGRLPAFSGSAMGGFCLASGLLSLLCHAMFESPAHPSASQWATLALLGLGPMGGAFFLWERALRLGDPRQIGSLSYSTPLLSTLLLSASGQGQLNSLAAVAILLILGGALLGTLPGRRHAQTQTT
ncbi:EamA family transporter [Chromobacterium violaceum]|uniref:EamA family transporter n=2 Tax=Chromobacterium violaceum TaxID=536 RepID=A0A202BD07_CHRVL|nr:DMT family transporter [Chromobacterium violaceum]KJH67275.1 permease [Chromobacterium violaceum]OQS47526.1 EamA family transporter [Chromobacterium violaceum]OQS48417.1 EamA family transporter [Chromobacterium violaceum]OVE49292.1 EamA family transporter [Chromobacterium violaceum]QRO34940.1 DMT family transporter [Chromobacterium violaceum]